MKESWRMMSEKKKSDAANPVWARFCQVQIDGWIDWITSIHINSYLDIESLDESKENQICENIGDKIGFIKTKIFIPMLVIILGIITKRLKKKFENNGLKKCIK